MQSKQIKPEDHKDSKPNLPVVAHQGGFELLDARWDLNSGRTVKFRIVETPETPLIVHPFNQFVRRRGNRVGTRFMAAISEVGTEKVMFNGELMLMSGGNPLQQGMWVSFWLDDEDTHHPFAGYAGRKRDNPGEMFMAVLVEIDDDEQAINQRKRDVVEKDGRRQQKLSNYAWSLCNNEMFLQYLSERATMSGAQLPASVWAKDDLAAKYIRWKCKLESRGELDRDPDAAERFHKLVREPYSNWRSVSDD